MNMTVLSYMPVPEEYIMSGGGPRIKNSGW